MLSTIAASVQAQTAEEFFDLGVRAYNKGDWDSAVENFSQSLTLNPNAAGFHNLGNSYAKLSKPGLARLNYERARYLSPRTPEIRANLARVIKDSGDTRRNSIADTLFGEFSNSEWTWGVIAGAWGAILCFAIIPHFVKRARFSKIFGAGFTIIFIFSISGYTYWSGVRNMAIAVSPDVLLRISPASKAPPSHAMSEAKSAKIIKRSGDYILVEFPAKKFGWCNKELLTPILPL